MQCTTLEPNGKFSVNSFWLDMGLTNSEKESKLFSGTRSVFAKSLAIYDFIYRCSTLHSLQVKKNSNNNNNKRKFGLFSLVKNCLKEGLLSILHFIIEGKGSSGKGLFLKFRQEFYLVACVF